MDGCPRRCLAFTMLGTLGELSLFSLVFSDFLIEGAHRGGFILCLTATILDPALAKRDQAHTNPAALIGMNSPIKRSGSGTLRRSNSTWSSSGSAGCPARKVERCLVMIGLRLPKKRGPVGIIFPPASFGNLLLMDPTA